MALRKIMEQREVDIIRRMKKVLKMTVADIARAADRNQSTIYRVLRRSWRPRQRGRPSALHRAEVNRIIQLINQIVPAKAIAADAQAPLAALAPTREVQMVLEDPSAA